MKSFDEVTKALSICGRHPDCEGCPYENVSYPTEIGNTCKDVMHYDALYYMQDRIDECQEANSPLTWQELKQMEGKPVWIEEENQPSQWCLIDEVETDEDDDPEFVSMTVFDCQGDYWFYKNNMGTKWQAYRKERK